MSAYSSEVDCTSAKLLVQVARGCYVGSKAFFDVPRQAGPVKTVWHSKESITQDSKFRVGYLFLRIILSSRCEGYYMVNAQTFTRIKQISMAMRPSVLR